jgi:hypothetical protein
MPNMSMIQLLNMSKITNDSTIKCVNNTDNSINHIWLEQFPEFKSFMFSSFVSHFHLANGHLGVE